jgi:soluble lytic murein transglycosylase-like protein
MQEIVKAIQDAATQAKIDGRLLQAICTVESSLNPRAIRFEPNYAWVYQTAQFAKKLNISQDTESACQRFSYGLGQVMGAVAREYGFKEHLMELFADTNQSVIYSAMHLAKFLKGKPKIEDAVACYNAGSVRRTESGLYVNQAYVDKVMREYSLLILAKK